MKRLRENYIQVCLKIIKKCFELNKEIRKV